MTLFEGCIDNEYVVDNIELNEKLENRLKTLGLLSGTKIKIINKKRNGAVIFNVRGTRLAVGKKIAQKINIFPS